MTDDSSKNFIRQVLTVVAVVCLVVLGLALLYFAFDVLMLVFAAILLAIFLHGLADLARRWVPLSQGYRVLIVSVVLLLIVVGAVALLAPSVADQARELRVEIPKSAQR